MATTDDQTQAENKGWLETSFKNHLAGIVFLISAGGILYTAHDASVAAESAVNKREIFNILVPLFGTWVGTILAFYFSRENFESANASVRRMADKLTPEQVLKETSVRQAMKIRSAIKAVIIPSGKDDDTVTLKDLQDILNQGNSRAPVFRADNSAKYVIHDSTLAKFVADRAMTQPGSVTNATKLSDMLPYKIGAEDFKSIVGKIAFVGLNASLSDARDAMLAVKGAQDVFVTKSGRPEEAIEGWLTNTDFARDL
ncbi:MAG: hypothetical protein EKK40_05780 [Bradyrhizobiaceae bacterium]|nr:MAG: hypothetical protein EKK40_05780 [Bradyrhizobiaceae bacterium]